MTRTVLFWVGLTSVAQVTAQAQTPPAATAAPASYCELLPAEQVQKITGATITRSAPASGGCAYYTQLASGFLKGEHPVVSLTPGPATAALVEAGKSAAQKAAGGIAVGASEVEGLGDRAIFYALTRQLVWARGGKGYTLLLGPGFQKGDDASARAALVDLAKVVNKNAK